MTRAHKPGEKAPNSGLYKIVGPRGANTGTQRTVAKGEVFPPTPKPGQKFQMDEPAKNKSGEG